MWASGSAGTPTTRRSWTTAVAVGRADPASWPRGPLGGNSRPTAVPSNRRQRRHVQADGTASYPNSVWFFAALLTLRDGLLHRENVVLRPADGGAAVGMAASVRTDR